MVGSKKSRTFAPANEKEGIFFACDPSLGYGVIGNTTDSGPVILGSSPDIPTKKHQRNVDAFFIHYTSVLIVQLMNCSIVLGIIVHYTL